MHVSAMVETGRIESTLPGRFPALGVQRNGAADETSPVSFADLLAKGLERLNELDQSRDQLTVDLALGRPVELHQVMLSAAKAQLALELLIELRNKVLEAYQEISRMAV